MTNYRSIEPPPPSDDQAVNPRLPVAAAPDIRGAAETGGDTSASLKSARLRMQQRSPFNLEVCTSLLEYAARLKPSPEPHRRKSGPIWQYWHSGRDNAPDICQTCFDSVKLYAADREITILDDNSIDRYIRLPSHILAKREQITPIHFADIVL